jgi:hypothetical protein
MAKKGQKTTHKNAQEALESKKIIVLIVILATLMFLFQTNPILASIWGNISAGNESQVFLYDYDNNITGLGYSVSLNCSANVTKGGVTLMNLSFWHNGTGTWHRNQTINLESFDGAHGVDWNSNTGTHSTYYGMRIQTDSHTFPDTIKVGRGNGTQPDALILNSSKDVVASTTWDGEEANFNYTLASDTVYYFVQSGEGFSTAVPSGGSIHNESDHFNWTGAIENDLDTEINYFDIVNLTFGGAESFRNELFDTVMNDTTLWGCSASDSEDAEGFSLYNKTEFPLIFWDTQSFKDITSEGSEERFEINVTLNAGLSLSSATLYYNNTANSGTITSQGNNKYTIAKTMFIPDVPAKTNLSFNWNLVLDTGTTLNTTSSEQEVSTLAIDDCGAYNVEILNYSLRDEETQLEINADVYNSTIEIDIDIYSVGDRSAPIIEYSQNYTENNNPRVCLQNNLTSDFEMDVEAFYDADGYAAEFNYIQNSSLTNTTTNNINLLDLKDSSSQEFKITFKDENFIAVENALIQIQRKYIDEGSFKTVEQPKTDENGETVGHFQLGDVVYNINVVKNGVTLAAFQNVRVVCQNPSLEDCEINLNSFASSISPEDYTSGDDFTYTLTYDRATRNIQSVFSVLSGATATVVLNATLFDNIGETQACSDSLTSSAGTLNCIVPIALGNGTVQVTLTKDNDIVGQAFIDLERTPTSLYGTSIVFLGLFISLTLVGMAIGDNPMVTGFFFILGAILLIALNVVDTGTSSFIGAGATVLWLVIAIVIVLIKGAKRA